MVSWLDPLDIVGKLIVALVLFIASLSDYKSREIDDKVWILGSIPLFAILVYRLYAGSIGLLLYLASLTISAILTATIWFTGIMGEADAIAILFIGLFYPPEPKQMFSLCPFPVISVIFNSLIIATFYIAYNLLLNISVLKKENVFDEYEASLLAKIFALTTLRYIDKREYRAKKYMYAPAEAVKNEKKTLLFNLTIPEEEAPEPPSEKFWAVVYLPYVLFITVGYILSITIGCPLDLLMR